MLARLANDLSIVQGTSEFSHILTAKTQASTQSYPPSIHRSHNNPNTNREVVNGLDHLNVVSSDTSVSNDTLYVVLGSVLGGLTVLVVLLVALYHCRQRAALSRSYFFLMFCMIVLFFIFYSFHLQNTIDLCGMISTD